MENVRFFICLTDGQPVMLNTHFKIGGDRRDLPLHIVADLIGAYKLDSSLRETPFEYITLHSSMDTPPIPIDQLLLDVTVGRTPATALIAKGWCIRGCLKFTFFTQSTTLMLHLLI